MSCPSVWRLAVKSPLVYIWSNSRRTIGKAEFFCSCVAVVTNSTPRQVSGILRFQCFQIIFICRWWWPVMVQFTILLQASPRWLDDSILNSSLVMSIHSDSFFRYLIFLEKYWFTWKSPASCLKVVQNSQCFDLPVDPRCSFGVAFEYECPGGCQERLATWWCTNPNHKWWVLINHPAASIMRWDRTCFVWLMFSTWRNKIQFTELGVNGIKNATVTETNIPTYEWYQVLVRTHDSS